MVLACPTSAARVGERFTLAPAHARLREGGDVRVGAQGRVGARGRFARWQRGRRPVAPRAATADRLGKGRREALRRAEAYRVVQRAARRLVELVVGPRRTEPRAQHAQVLRADAQHAARLPARAQRSGHLGEARALLDDERAAVPTRRGGGRPFEPQLDDRLAHSGRRPHVRQEGLLAEGQLGRVPLVEEKEVVHRAAERQRQRVVGRVAASFQPVPEAVTPALQLRHDQRAPRRARERERVSEHLALPRVDGDVSARVVCLVQALAVCDVGGAEERAGELEKVAVGEVGLGVDRPQPVLAQPLPLAQRVGRGVCELVRGVHHEGRESCLLAQPLHEEGMSVGELRDRKGCQREAHKLPRGWRAPTGRGLERVRRRTRVGELRLALE
mmetsp:Transcript_36735/g.91528  ORF Transcript_36735/g.91528 Transcript_36735/m.91528 type:complete len:387 (+) Transcript_36735:43-1203(+)